MAKILIIDDDATIRLLMRETLSFVSFEASFIVKNLSSITNPYYPLLSMIVFQTTKKPVFWAS